MTRSPWRHSWHGAGNRPGTPRWRKISAGQTGDIATLIYTSGTTGDPKGVVLTHANFVNQFYAIDDRFRVAEPMTGACASCRSSHAYERTWSYYILSVRRGEQLPSRSERHRGSCRR
ncbi:MAG: AMP-binding protein [Desulfobacterales bacterium]|nr:AMP-binding protein [Desulfobacterales bacterium]